MYLRKEFKVSKYEKEGFEGLDVNLSCSLNEYGLIWKKFKRATQKGFAKGEYLFVYINSCGDLDWAGDIHTKTDLKEEFNWVEWYEVLDYTGLSGEEFFNQEVHHIVASLVSYYGTANVFGS